MFDIYNETTEEYFLRRIAIDDFQKNNFCIFDLEGTGLNRTEDSMPVTSARSAVSATKFAVHPASL